VTLVYYIPLGLYAIIHSQQDVGAHLVISEIFSPDVMTSNIFGLSESLITYTYIFIYRPDSQLCSTMSTGVHCISGSHVPSFLMHNGDGIDRFIDQRC
jgi:hypothetical protein